MRTPRILCRADLWMIDNLSLKLYILFYKNRTATSATTEKLIGD